MGDFNLNLLSQQFDNNIGNLVHTLYEYFYFPIITKPTRVQNRTASLLDHVLANFGHDSIQNSEIIFNGITDHFPVIYHLKVCSATKNYKLIKYRVSGEECDNHFRNKIENYNWITLLDIDDVDEAFRYFNDRLAAFYNECYPIRSKRIRTDCCNSLWMTPGLKESIKTKNKLYKKICQATDNLRPSISYV